MRHTAHVSNQVVKKPSQNPTKTPILEGIGVFLGVKKFVYQLPKLPKSDNKPTRGKIVLTNTNPTGEIMGKIMGNHRISTKQQGFFPNQPTEIDQKVQPSTGKAPDIHSSAEPIFPTLQVPLPPTMIRLVVGWEKMLLLVGKQRKS